jgi:LysR family transcriptional regulator, regulator for bpeEF and oprC
VARRVGMVEFVTCATPAYLERHGVPVHPHDLMQHRCVNYFSSKTGRISGWDFSKDGERIDLQLDGSVALNDGEAYLEAGLAGLGVVQTAAFMVNDALAAGMLVRVLADWEIEPLPVWIMYPQNRHLSAKVRVFVEWIAELFSARGASQTKRLAAGPRVRATAPSDPVPHL